ncbi:DNA fragmentation factor subunit alpha [Anopheles cruzii]|uniref:DNA fragmentation factor subunit alpha n=1 Tax=Anopheles cruzii TaxID=68878 RepID=UPI0022EC624D|nr:DNA fragmentation factor subunit alpha [Anopheles cruzii]
MESERQKAPYKIKDVTRAVKKAVVAATLAEVRVKAAEKFGRQDLPNIHLDSDGTEVDDEDYFQTLEPNAELIAVFSDQQWVDPTHYVTITTRRDSSDVTDSPEVERIHLKKLVSHMKTNVCNVSVLSEPDLELLSNMDPNSFADITGKDFVEQLKEASGRILYEKRQAFDAIKLLKLFAKRQEQSEEESQCATTQFSAITNQPQSRMEMTAAAAESSSSSPSTPSTTVLADSKPTDSVAIVAETVGESR